MTSGRSPLPRLTPEEIVLWLDGHRQFMWEIWRHNPGTRERWEKINQTNSEWGVLFGRGVLLRSPEEKDYPALKAILNDTETMRALIPFFKKTVWSNEDVKERYERFRKYQEEGTGQSWVVVEHPTGKIVGHCGFKNIDKRVGEAEYGAILHRAVWGNGIHRECSRLCLDYAFWRLGLKSVFFLTDPSNERASRFLKGVSARFTRKEPNGQLRYELSRENWRKR